MSCRWWRCGRAVFLSEQKKKLNLVCLPAGVVRLDVVIDWDPKPGSRSSIIDQKWLKWRRRRFRTERKPRRRKRGDPSGATPSWSLTSTPSPSRWPPGSSARSSTSAWRKVGSPGRFCTFPRPGYLVPEVPAAVCVSSVAAKGKNIRRGVKEVQKFINKGEKGWVPGVRGHVGWQLQGANTSGKVFTR